MGGRLLGAAVAAVLVLGCGPGWAGDGRYENGLGDLMRGYPLPAADQVTLENWLAFPFNRWAFRNMRALFPTGGLRPSGAAAELEWGKPLDVAALTFKGADGNFTTAADYFRREFIDGFIVLHKGRIVYEAYFSGMKPEDLHLWQSMTKSVTGILAEMLIEEGTLDPAKMADSYVPEIAGTVWGKASLRDLLDMAVNVREPSTRAAEQPEGFWTKVNFLASLKAPGAEQAGRNGQTFYYTNSAPSTLGLVMTKVTGKSWHQLAGTSSGQSLAPSPRVIYGSTAMDRALPRAD